MSFGGYVLSFSWVKPSGVIVESQDKCFTSIMRQWQVFPQSDCFASPPTLGEPSGCTTSSSTPRQCLVIVSLSRFGHFIRYVVVSLLFFFLIADTWAFKNFTWVCNDEPPGPHIWFFFIIPLEETPGSRVSWPKNITFRSSLKLQLTLPLWLHQDCPASCLLPGLSMVFRKRVANF